MLSKRWVLLIFVVFLLGTTVSAYDLVDRVDIDSSKEWVVANKLDNATISVQLWNISHSSKILEEKVPVTFTLSDPYYGKLSSYTAETDSSGMATVMFTANTTKGNVTITAHARNVTDSHLQKIDHDSPYYVTFDYDGEVVVNETTPIAATYMDYWGNLIDEENPAETHTATFIVSSPKGDAGFLSGGNYVDEITQTIDNNGIITLECKVDSYHGDNIVYMSPVGKITAQYFTISGISQGIPFSMVAEMTPVSVYANGDDLFYLAFTLYDAFGNPTANRSIAITTSLGETELVTTNSLGQRTATYGPNTTAQNVQIVVTAVDNSSVTQNFTAIFINTDPTNIVVTANPETMASRDVPGSTPSTIRAKVMDDSGNAVAGETVTFTLLSFTSTTPLTSNPSFSASSYVTSVTGTTDENGLAEVSFYAGAFPTSGALYNSTASGTASLAVLWGNYTRPVTVSFKNYPYLSVKTNVEPSVVGPNETFDVTIQLIGDGWKLQAKPIDVDLVFDRSGSMAWDSPTRLSQAKTAANIFVNNMTTQDQVGLVPFSSSATVSQTLTNNFPALKLKINSLTADGATALRKGVNTGIADLVTNGRSNAVKAIIVMTDGEWNYDGSPLGHGIGWPYNNTGNYVSGGDYTFSGNTLEPDNYEWYPGLGGNLTGYNSTTCSQYGTTCEEYDNYCQTCAPGYSKSGGRCCSGWSCYYPSQRPSWCSVLRCGEYNCLAYSQKYKCYDGEFTQQNMSLYAIGHGIRIYTITFAYTPSTEAAEGMQILAESTGGFYAHAPNGATLQQIYLQIAGELKSIAGVNTEMDLSFQDVNFTYNNVTSQVDGATLFTYEYDGTNSTYVSSHNKTVNPLPDTLSLPASYDDISWLGALGANHYPYSFNQIDDWLSGSGLSFTVGNISVNQTWETKFRFRVGPYTNGTIDVFGPGSIITMDGGAETLKLPHTFVSVIPNMTGNGTATSTIDVYDLDRVGAGNVTDFLPVSWSVDYTGPAVTTITETIYYTNKPVKLNQWVRYDTHTITNVVGGSTFSDDATLDVRTLPYGEYFIKVYAIDTTGAEDSEILMTPITVGSEGTAYIKLE